MFILTASRVFINTYSIDYIYRNTVQCTHSVINGLNVGWWSCNCTPLSIILYNFKSNFSEQNLASTKFWIRLLCFTQILEDFLFYIILKYIFRSRITYSYMDGCIIIEITFETLIHEYLFYPVLWMHGCMYVLYNYMYVQVII